MSLNPNFSLTRAYAHPAEEEEEKVVAVEKADADGEAERVKEEEEGEEEQVQMQGRRDRERQREAISTGAGMRLGREAHRKIERETGGNRWRKKERRVLSGLRTLISGSQGSAQVVNATYTYSLAGS